MASKKTKPAPADDDIDELFSGITEESKPSSKKPSTAKASKPATAASAKPTADDDLFADLESQLTSQQTSSRPHTPRLSKDVKRPVPPTTAAAATSDAARKSTDSARSLRASFTPSATSSELHESEKKGTVEQAEQAGAAGGAGGSWWGGWVSTATATANAAMKQAEAAYKEIQQNEEAKKWTEQVKGIRSLDVEALKHYGTSSTEDPSQLTWTYDQAINVCNGY